MKFRKHILILPLLTIPFFSAAQTDYEKIVSELQLRAASLLEANNPVEAKVYIDSALNYMPTIPSLKTKGKVSITASAVYSKLTYNIEALKFLLIAANNFEKLNDSTTLSDIYYQVALFYFNQGAYSKSLENFDMCLKFRPAEQIDFELLQKVDEYKASCYFYMRNFEKAENIYRQLYTSYSEKSLDNQALAALNNVVLSLENQKKYAEAISCNRILYGIYNSNFQVLKVIEVLNNIGYNYIQLENYDEAKKSFLNAEKLLGKSNFDDNFLATLYTNIGICFQNTGDYRTAISYLSAAILLREKENNFEEIATTNNILALVYFRNNDLYNAIEFCKDAIENAEKTPAISLQSQCYKTYSTVLQAAEDYQMALDYYKQHLMLQDSLIRAERLRSEQLDQKIFELEKNEKELKLKIVEGNVKDILLEQLQLKAKQREQENEILRKEKALQESEKERIEQSLVLVKQQNEALLRKKEIENLEREKTLKENELKLKEAQEKEQAKAFELLKSEKEKQSLELQKQDLILEKQAEKEKRFIWIMALTVIIITIGVITLILTKKKNRILSQQKHEILEKNEELIAQKEEIRAAADSLQEANYLLIEKNNKIEQQSFHIISSIQYAKRIQQAVLPQKESITELIPSHFVLFRPRDIVSGDFYWVKQIENFIYVAVADCTGHGVPGAFMSMLGTAFLNEITGKGEVLMPAEILNELREKVKKSLRQVGKSGEAKDGMDMVMIMVDLESKELSFAGANNSIIHIRGNGIPDQPEVIKLKGDRMPIGISLKESSFSSQKISLVPNDMIYLYTDGYIDQMGGKERRVKFMTKNFIDVLKKIYDKPVAEQKHQLNTTLVDWMDGYDQLDDILVVGIKFTDVYGEVNLF